MTNLHYEFRVSPHHFTEIVQAVRDAGGEVNAAEMKLDGLTAGYAYHPGNLVLTFEPKAADNAKYPDWVDNQPQELPLVKLIEEHRGKPVPAAWPPIPPKDDAEVLLVPEPVAVGETDTVEKKRGGKKGE